MNPNCDPGGIYGLTPDVLAATDQERAKVMEGLRTSDAISITWLDKQNNATHWAICVDGEDGDRAMTFLIYSVCHAWRDVQSLTELDDGGVADLILDALKEGVGQ